MAILMPALNRVREQGKRAVCLSHLRQLGIVWIMYADDNDGKIVNGAAGHSGTPAMRVTTIQIIAEIVACDI